MNEPIEQRMKIKYASSGIQDLKPGKAGSMELSDGTTANFGVIRVKQDGFVHYTGQGLRVMWKPNMSEEEQAVADKLKALLKEPDGEQRLMALGHIARTPLESILRIL